MKKTIVISLGGSLIIPNKINYSFLKQFKKTLESRYKTHKFVIVTGGGSLARQYISTLKKQKKSKRSLSLAGIRATRQNARFLMQFFGKQANDTLPLNMKQVKANLRNNSIVICGALRYAENETSDGTAAKLSNLLKTDFINMTNVKGLYSSNPKTNKKAKFISKISWQDFETQAKKIKYKAGQHFVLDQSASTIIKKHKIKTYIIGPNLKNLSRILKNKKFTGTIIEG
tara:strand:+ start:845 stop:1531 length:687 start_codon:yes stop_codon:yes gene_type:complete